MPYFMVHVKLEEADPVDYEILAAALAQRRFKTPAADRPQPRDGSLTHKFFVPENSVLTVAAGISASAETTGRKYAFTVMREKGSHAQRLVLP